MDGVRAALQRMLGPNVSVAVTNPVEAGGLWPDEQDAIARAIPKRQAEFAAGRRAARGALAELGVPPISIPIGANRAPVWPDGFCGSIAHCGTCCVAVAAHTRERLTLGIDVEPASPLDADLIDIICTASERQWIGTRPVPELAAKQIFSAKEAVFKAQYPLTGLVIGFDALSLEIENGCFAVTTHSPLPNLKGTILIHDGLILSVAHV